MHIEEYSPHWQEKVCALADRVFGAGYFANPTQIAQDPDTCLFVSVSSDEEVVGFVYGRVLPKDALADFLEHRLPDLPQDLKEADDEGVLGVIQTVAVAPDQRGKGVGTNLLRVVHDAIVGRGADKLIVTFKRGPVEAAVDNLMAGLGFETWIKLPTYFKERCEQGSFDCIHRKDGCTCEAILYRKKVY